MTKYVSNYTGSTILGP